MQKKYKISDLTLIGLSNKDTEIYMTLVSLGSAPLRRIAQESKMSRSTVHDALRKLMDMGLVGFVDSKQHRFFTAEDPQRLHSLMIRKELDVQEAREKLEVQIPQMQALFGAMSYRPTVRYYEGSSGVKAILQDVLATCEKSRSKTYRVYSSAGIRDLIASAWPRFSSTRKQRGVSVRAVALGEGGKTIGLDERKWLTRKESAPAYIFIYDKKTAYVSADDRGRLFGAIIDDEPIAQTQKMIFDQLWEHLG
jgi:sugar-specific transcriptional regulator TrmB